MTDERAPAEIGGRDVFTLLRAGREIGERILKNRRAMGQLAALKDEFEAWLFEVADVCDGAFAQYATAVCEQTEHVDGDVLIGPPPDPQRVLIELTLDELSKGPLAALEDRLPAVPESGNVPLPNGCRLYWTTDKSINTRVYCSDEIGGGVEVWNPALVSEDTLLAAIVTESHLGKLEVEHARRRLGDTMRQRMHWFSIFGQIEAAAAQVMIDGGEITRIPPEQIPASVALNERKEPALFAVIVPANKLERFETLIANLRA